MIEQEKPQFTLGLIRSAAITIFKENDSYDDEKGLHPNTLRRSSEKAVDKVISDSGLSVLDFYSMLSVSEFLPSMAKLRLEHYKDQDINRIIKKMFSVLIHKDLSSNCPELVSDQEYRIQRFGRL